MRPLFIAGFFSPFLDGNDDNYQTKWPKLTLCGPFSITHRIRAQQKQYVDFPLQSSRAVAVELTRKRFPPPCLADVFKGSSHQHLPSGAVVQWQNSAIINDCTGGGSIPPSPSTSQMLWSFGPAFSSELLSPASVVHGLKRPCLFGLQVRSLLGVPNSCPEPQRTQQPRHTVFDQALLFQVRIQFVFVVYYNACDMAAVSS